MYLVQEYFDCATLHTRLTGNTKMEALKDGMKSIFDIIDGMEFIHSYGVSIHFSIFCPSLLFYMVLCCD